MADLTILLYGPTGSGKTSLLGELIEWVYKTKKLYSRLATCDKGGVKPLQPYLDLNLLHLVESLDSDDPWLWLDHVTKGHMPGPGGWDTMVPKMGASDLENKVRVTKQGSVGLWAFEGISWASDWLMEWMAAEGAKQGGVQIGGQGSITFVASQGPEKLKISSNNQGQYKMAQDYISRMIRQSQRLPGIVVWTAADRLATDDVAGGIIGPQASGKALTPDLPRAFNYCLRVAAETQYNGPTKHVLYTDAHAEARAGGATAISNGRIPLDGQSVAIPAKIEPASVVEFLNLIHQRTAAATDDIRKRLGL